MSDATTTVIPKEDKPSTRAQAIAAWFACEAQADKVSAVKKFPELKDIFAEASNINTK